MSHPAPDPRIPHPSVFIQPPSSWCPGKNKKVFAVTEGRPPGLYIDWIECCEAVNNVKSAKFKGYKFWAEAYKIYEAAYNSGAVRYGQLKGETPGRSAANPVFVHSRDNTPAPDIPSHRPHTPTPTAPARPAHISARNELPTPAATQARSNPPPAKTRQSPATTQPQTARAPSPRMANKPVTVNKSPAPRRKKPTTSFRPDPNQVYIIEDSPSPEGSPVTLRTNVQATGTTVATLSANAQTVTSAVATLSSQVQIGGAAILLAEASTVTHRLSPRTPTMAPSTHTTPRTRYATPPPNPSTPGPINSGSGRPMGRAQPRTRYQSPSVHSSPSTYSSQPYHSSPPVDRVLFPPVHNPPPPAMFNAHGTTSATNVEQVQFTVSFTVGPTPPRPSPARIPEPTSPLAADDALALFSQDDEAFFNGAGYDWGPDPSPEDLERLYEHETRTPPPLNSPPQSPPSRVHAARTGRSRRY